MSTSPQPLSQDGFPKERHYTTAEIAKLWNVNNAVVLRLFRHEAGVLHFGSPVSRQVGRRYVRRREILRISQSAFERVQQQLQQKRAPGRIDKDNHRARRRA